MQDQEGLTPLHECVKACYTEPVRRIRNDGWVRTGMHKDDFPSTTRGAANAVSVVVDLLRRGADPTIASSEHGTPADLARTMLAASKEKLPRQWVKGTDPELNISEKSGEVLPDPEDGPVRWSKFREQEGEAQRQLEALADVLLVARLIFQAKHKGNQLFTEGNYEEAARFYEDALTKLPDMRRDLPAVEAAICSNVSQCYLKTEQYDECLAACDRALKCDPVKTIKAKVVARQKIAKDKLR